MKRLEVFYDGFGEHWHLSSLLDVDGRLYFEYAPSAIQQGLDLSPLQYPLPRAGAMQQVQATQRHLPQFMGLPGFIADSLPDGWGMLLMDKALRRAGRDPASISVLERLAMVGSGAMGALSFEPSQEDALDAQIVDLLALAKEMSSVLNDADASLTAEQLERLMKLGGSPQGARPKALLDVDGKPWLFKFPAQGEHPEVCAMEELYARFVRKHQREGGGMMPASRLYELDGKHSAFAVQRFDRVLRGNSWRRVPMLSLSALLHADHRLPSLDYETVLLATTRLTGDLSETVKAFERTVLHAMLHNRDDHAKNIAYCLNERRQWKLSPVFDLTYSNGPSGEHSTSFCGEGKRPTRERLLQVAKNGGVKERIALEVLNYWLEALSSLPLLAQELPVRAKTLSDMKSKLNGLWNDLKR